MKNKNYLSLAILLTAFLGSCSSDDPVISPAGDGERVEVTFTTEIPTQISSRGEEYSTGSEATDLYYFVYHAIKDDEGTTTKLKLESKGLAELEKNSSGVYAQTLTFNLVKNEEYVVSFWAQKGKNAVAGDDSTTPGDDEAPYTINAETGVISMNYDKGGGNNEARDAFFGKTVQFSTAAAKSFNVTLTRPFAQLNIGTTSADLDALEELGIEYTKAKVSTRVHSGFDIKGGVVTEDYAEVAFEGGIPEDATFPYESETYQYLAMNYLLADGDGEVIDVNFEVSGEDGSDYGTKKSKYTSVPIRQNYRTNIFGNLLTTTAAVTVAQSVGFTQYSGGSYFSGGIVNSDADYSKEITSVAALQIAFQAGTSGTLTTDITYAGLSSISPSVPNANIVIDLGGYTLTLGTNSVAIGKTTPVNVTFKNGKIVSNVSGTNSAFEVYGGSSLTLDGVELTVENANGIIPVGESTVTIKNTSKITAKTYAVATGTGNDSGQTININSSTLTAATALLVNVPATVTLTSSSFYGTSQGALLRAGTYTLSKNKFYLSLGSRKTLLGTDEDANKEQYLYSDWDDGNLAPIAPLVIGNRSSSYQYATTFTSTLVGNSASITTAASGGYAVADYYNMYVYANQGEDLGVYFTTSYKPTISKNSKGIKIASDNIYLGNTQVDQTTN